MQIVAADLVNTKQIYSEAWEFFKAHWGRVYKFGLIYGLLIYGPQFIFSIVGESLGEGLLFFLTVALIVWQIIVAMGGIVAFFALVRNKSEDNLGVDVFLSQKSRFWSYIWASIRYQLIVNIGLILLIIPGIVWAIKYRFAIFLLLDKKLSVKEAFDVSAQMTEGIKWKILVFDLFGVLVTLGGLLLLGVGLFVAIPVVYLAYFMLYDRLLSRTKLGISQEAQQLA